MVTESVWSHTPTKRNEEPEEYTKKTFKKLKLQVTKQEK